MSQRPKYDHRYEQPMQNTYGNPNSLTYSKYTPVSSTTTSSSKQSHRRSYGDSTIFPSESPFRNFNSPIASPPQKPSSSDVKRRSLSNDLIKSPPKEPVRFSTPTRTFSPSEPLRNYSKSGSPYGSYDYSMDRNQMNDKQYTSRSTTERDSPLKSIKKYEFESMFRKNYKYIDKCLLIASENDYQTFGVSTSSLPTCLEMGTQLLYRVIEPSKITNNLIDNVLQLGAFQDPQQGILDAEHILRMNERFNKLLDLQAAASITLGELTSLSSKVDRVLETKRRSCLLVLQQNTMTKLIYSILDQEYGEIVHVIFDPHSQKTNSTLHGSSVLILIGNNVKKYLTEWLDFAPESEVKYSIFFRRPEVDFYKFSFDKVKETSTSVSPPPSSISDIKKKIENERKVKQDLVVRLDDQKKLISSLEMEIAQIESDYNEDSKAYMANEKTRRILAEVMHLLSSNK